MPSITLRDLSVGYQHPRRTPTTVLAQLNATLHAGQLTCLVGANGIGKSTLLRTLAAFQPPIAGQMHYYSGEQVAPINLVSLSQARLARLVSVVLTAKPSVENLSVEQIVGLGRSPYTNIWGTLRAEDHRMVEWAMDVVGITSLRHRQVQTLSDGERQKMMIAKALAQDTPVILLDEPTAFLDYKSKVEVLGLLARLAHETNKMVLLSTHDLEQAVHAADALWVVAKQQLGDGTQPCSRSDSSDRSDQSDQSDRPNGLDAPNSFSQYHHLPLLYVLEKHIHTTEQGHQQLVFEPAPTAPAPPHLTLTATPNFETRTQELLRLLGEEGIKR
ncbi:ABC transporter ATP-binding protein [Prevotella sp. oral taxon 317]|uniref:ABC transporter ATP-binding protein n=1 Tax=Prevotella sp. oral taxon 317 TaxID=652721 RepID=UPI0001C3FE6B|nr:ABC transporter ATP-binding protein [Prevotella sp. oral taxon 317]EFC68374.1 iron(III) dicitrate ABC transporter, ATP-binding protein FecE family protein [Prevotella sp. oral taxon 317 str. F0108]